MLAQEISIPVYFSNYDTELDEIIEDISKIKADEPDDVADIKAAGKRDSALSEIVNSISANGYQVSIQCFYHFDLQWPNFIYLLLLKGTSDRCTSFAQQTV